MLLAIILVFFAGVASGQLSDIDLGMVDIIEKDVDTDTVCHIDDLTEVLRKDKRSGTSLACMGNVLILKPSVECGINVQRGLMGKPPSVTYNDAIPGDYYTLLLVDPDAPGHTPPLAWRHWLVVNIKGTDISTGNIRGETVTKYAPPTPPDGAHRYIYFLFHQNASLEEVMAVDTRRRGKFDVTRFLKDNDLCSPDASFMYITE